MWQVKVKKSVPRNSVKSRCENLKSYIRLCFVIPGSDWAQVKGFTAVSVFYQFSENTSRAEQCNPA